ncbi:MAG: prolyl oligopeptidase family serine peptidase [Planctomyces sp.]|nr:prolyl oligopeptidase family serine peptidase [Planctomyces sp.]
MNQLLTIVVAFLIVVELPAQDAVPVGQEHQAFLKAAGQRLRADDESPKTVEEWERTKSELRAGLLKAWGGLELERCDLSPQLLGTIPRDGYRIERLLIQTMPGIWMTANAWVPEPAAERAGSTGEMGRYPAVLCVHGHWKGAKQDPVVQSRCIGLARLGFLVLCVDAFGAGERAVGEALGEYHGELTGAMLLPVGMPLSGIQVYENMRAVDYLISRSDVDPERIGITGASGGGNQTMYAGAFDERFRCVVPTCSVGNYQSYLSAACCMCEVVPGALRFTEEGNVLGLASGRGLMVTSATEDAYQFSVDQARVSVTRATEISRLIGGTEVRHTIIESPHHYNEPMREAMYGWMTLHLKGEGDGSPIPEPEIQPEDPEVIRCFPRDTRPDDYVTLPRFAAREANRILEERSKRKHPAFFESKAQRSEEKEILKGLLGGPVQSGDLKTAVHPVMDKEGRAEPWGELVLESEPGIVLRAMVDSVEKGVDSAGSRLMLLVDTERRCDQVIRSDEARRLRGEGFRILAVELRGTGRLANPSDAIANAADHNSAEWSLWIGRPLIGQWCHDIRRTLDAMAEIEGGLPEEIEISGEKSSAFVSLTAAVLDERIDHVHAYDLVATFVSETPYRGLRLGILIPGLFRETGDVADIAALMCPRRLTIYDAVNGNGDVLDAEECRSIFEWTEFIYRSSGVSENFRNTGSGHD